MIAALVLELRKNRVRVGMQEAVALAQALSRGLHANSLNDFYYLARAILIHDETHLDTFDQVFSHLYKGVPYSSKKLLEELADWLANPLERPNLSEAEKAALKELNIDELRKLFEERLKEQKERHDGGSHWIGTGGTSPFGSRGYHPSGISLRAGEAGDAAGGRSSLREADARKYRGYRSDLVLDVRQIEMALRKLRSFGREGLQSELDLKETVHATARNFGDLELVFRKPRRPETRVILMMDVGGSMDPFAQLVSQLFTAARRATHWRELRTYYFHNCIYGKVYRTEGLRDAVSVRELARECDDRYKLILVGDAAMAPYELLGGGESAQDESDAVAGVQWLMGLARHFSSAIWLNPDFSPLWMASTTKTIAQIFPMFPLTLAGLDEGLQKLKKK